MEPNGRMPLGRHSEEQISMMALLQQYNPVDQLPHFGSVDPMSFFRQSIGKDRALAQMCVSEPNEERPCRYGVTWLCGSGFERNLAIN